MASATKKAVEKTITEDVIVLELTKEEADWLRGYLGASPSCDESMSIYEALDAPADVPDDRPIEVGDKVRITAVGEGDGIYLHKVGKLDKIDRPDPDLPFLVLLADSDYVWVRTVERVND